MTQETNFYPWQSCASRNKENSNLNMSQHFKTLKVLIAVYSQFEIPGYPVGCYIHLWYIYIIVCLGGFFLVFWLFFFVLGWGFWGVFFGMSVISLNFEIVRNGMLF